MRSVYTIAILFFCLMGAAQAQTPNWLWTESTKVGDGEMFNTSISTNANGKIYTAGSFSTP